MGQTGVRARPYLGHNWPEADPQQFGLSKHSQWFQTIHLWLTKNTAIVDGGVFLSEPIYSVGGPASFFPIDTVTSLLYEPVATSSPM